MLYIFININNIIEKYIITFPIMNILLYRIIRRYNTQFNLNYNM